MERLLVQPRKDWREKVEKQGLIFHTIDGLPYWNESAAYRFEEREILEIEKVTNELWDLCLNAAQHIIDHERFSDLAIPPEAIPKILQSWEEEPPSVYARFDFVYNDHSLKMLEINADTPTSLLEASVIQWYWLQDYLSTADQFNSIHEKLVAKWKELRGYISGETLYFSSVQNSTEDQMTTAYLQDTADQAGFMTCFIPIEEIGWNNQTRRFVDLKGLQIRSIFKLYPWEWMYADSFGKYLNDCPGIQWIEPAWKMLLSNKGILPILWELNPGHPNLLPAFFGNDPHGMDAYVSKPLLSREGANVRIIRKGEVIASAPGDYGEEGYIVQGYQPLPDFGNNFPVIGSWLIDGEAAGIGIRETNGPITDNLSRFVPHFFQ